MSRAVWTVIMTMTITFYEKVLPICKVLSQYSDCKFLSYDRVYLKLYKVIVVVPASMIQVRISWTGFAATWLLCHNADLPPPPPPPPAPLLFTGLWIAPGAVKSMLGSNCRAVHCQRVNWLWCIRLWPSRVQILHQWSPLPTIGAGGSVGVGVVLVLVGWQWTAMHCNDVAVVAEWKFDTQWAPRWDCDTRNLLGLKGT